MVCRFAIVVFLGVGLAGNAQDAKVCLADEVHSLKAQLKDKVTVASIFRRIGVDVRWEDCAGSEFEIRVMEHAPAGARTEVLATTLLASRTIHVYADRVRRLLARMLSVVREGCILRVDVAPESCKAAPRPAATKPLVSPPYIRPDPVA